MSSNLVISSSPKAETGVKMPPRCARGVSLDTLSESGSRYAEVDEETVGRRKQSADSAIITERQNNTVQ